MPVKKAKGSVAKKGPFARKHYNYGRWTKGRFSEAVTVTGPAKIIFLAGIGSEHEQTGKILYPGDFDAQCRYAFLKMKKVLAKNGARLADVVKQVTYVTDARYAGQAGERRREAKHARDRTHSCHVTLRIVARAPEKRVHSSHGESLRRDYAPSAGRKWPHESDAARACRAAGGESACPP